MTNLSFFIDGMTCGACKERIEKKLSNTDGIDKVSVSYEKRTANVTFDEKIIDVAKIFEVVEKTGYTPRTSAKHGAALKNVAVIAAIIAVFALMKHFGITQIFNNFSVVDSSAGYGMLFVIGLTTSVHCIAMCGGINISQCLSAKNAVAPSFLYNTGRVISYTLVGGAVGALGSLISLDGGFRAIFMMAAGFFMVIAGINIGGGGFAWMKKLSPRLPQLFKQDAKSPIVVGLLNGFMPCGPLQSMQIYALYTGSVAAGAVSMFLFALGTLPLMFALGAASSMLSRTFRETAVKIGACLVMILGLIMLSNGLSLSGITLDFGFAANVASDGSYAVEDGVQVVHSHLESGAYPAIVVKENMPVRWIIQAEKKDINGCNDRIFINEYGIEHNFEAGENIIEFTPVRRGRFVYSCWMGMIKSTICVIKNDEAQ